MRASASSRELFWRKVSKGDDCWLWQGARTRGGGGFYGSFRLEGRSRGAHRIAYEWERGPIPDGLVLDHLCRTTLCVNPAHLEPTTIVENVRRGQTAVHRAAERDGEAWIAAQQMRDTPYQSPTGDMIASALQRARTEARRHT